MQAAVGVAASRAARVGVFALALLAPIGLLLSGLGCGSDGVPALPDEGIQADSGAPFIRPPMPPPLIRYRGEVLEPARGKGPPYPIILVHGFFGFESIGPFTYFHNVKGALEKDGHDVHIAVLDPFNSSYVRGPQLATFVDEVLAQTGAAKVNMIAHSQGGLDARYVASLAPQKVGAIFTVATPHLGDELADIMLGRLPGFSKDLLKAFAAALGRPFYGDIAQDTDLKASMEFLATDSVKAFNAKHPDQPQVRYYSVGGRSGLALAEDTCLAPLAPPFITQWNKDRDPVDLLLVPTWTVLAGSVLSPEANDGIVHTASTKWGTWLGCIPADHFDQIGQLAGDKPGIGNSFDHVAFYRHVADYLVKQGY